MEGGLLSLKWNNHKSTFFHVLSNVRKKKDSYSDATLACDGKFYPVHKLVLSSCSDYFEEMFDQAGQAQCKHPFIVLKDIKCDELECLLSYMYVGEVNVVQEKLAGLIKAAECLRIKGLAVPDEEPSNSSNKSSREKRQSDNSVNSEPKRRRHEDTNSTPNSRQQINRIEERRKQFNDSSIGSNKLKAPSSSVDNAETADSRTKENEDSEIVKNESFLDDNDVPEEILLDDPPQDQVKAEPPEDLDLYHAESNSIPGDKEELLSDGYGDNTTESQQHFMDDLLGNSSDAGHLGALGDFARDGGESSSHVGGSQQSMVKIEMSEVLAQVLASNEENQQENGLPCRRRKFKCPHCDLQCVYYYQLQDHMNTHSGEKPNVCSICSYKTSHTSCLRRHLKYKHGMTMNENVNLHKKNVARSLKKKKQ